MNEAGLFDRTSHVFTRRSTKAHDLSQVLALVEPGKGLCGGSSPVKVYMTVCTAGIHRVKQTRGSNWSRAEVQRLMFLLAGVEAGSTGILLGLPVGSKTASNPRQILMCVWELLKPFRNQLPL